MPEKAWRFGILRDCGGKGRPLRLVEGGTSNAEHHQTLWVAPYCLYEGSNPSSPIGETRTFFNNPTCSLCAMGGNSPQDGAKAAHDSHKVDDSGSSPLPAISRVS